MIRMIAAGAAALWAASATAAADEAGAFDYYVLALSWNASWCEIEGDARDADQCDASRDHGFVVHGLWPQYERGWPDFCPTDRGGPTRRQSAAMADIMGSGGLAYHQWRKHGVCTGLAATDYFALTREALARVSRPEVLRALDEAVRVAPDVVEAAFLEANPRMVADGVTVTCREGRVLEVRICLDRSLEPRACAPDAARDCSAAAARLPPMR